MTLTQLYNEFVTKYVKSIPALRLLDKLVAAAREEGKRETKSMARGV